MLLKAYVELVEGKRNKKKVEYDNFKTVTHLTIFLILVAWISFHLSLSPVYGTFKTWVIMGKRKRGGHKNACTCHITLSHPPHFPSFFYHFVSGVWIWRPSSICIYDTSLGAEHIVCNFDDIFFADVQVMFRNMGANMARGTLINLLGYWILSDEFRCFWLILLRPTIPHSNLKVAIAPASYVWLTDPRFTQSLDEMLILNV